MTKKDRLTAFGKRLDKLMEAKSIDGEALSRLTGTNRTTITRARNGVLIPSRPIARILALSLDQPSNIFDDLYLPETLDGEEWKPLSRYPKYYGSNKYRIMNSDTGRILKPVRGKRTDALVQLCSDGKKHTERVKKLIDETFIEKNC